MSTLPRRLKRAISSERKNDVRAATTPSTQTNRANRPDSELLDLLFDFQTDRLDEQRCSWPDKDARSASMARRVDAILKKDGPRPMILLPSEGFRCHGWSPTDEEKEKDANSIECKIQSDEMLMNYRRHFLNKDHENFYCLDDYLGPLLMSVRCVLANRQPSKSTRSWEEYRVIARTRHDTYWQIIPTSEFPSEDPRPEDIAKYVLKEQHVARMRPATGDEVPGWVLKFDEHNLQTKHKFGVIFQRIGQTEEEEMFGNEHHGAAMEEFLDVIGSTVDLKGFQGYAGGLDAKNETTGSRSVYTEFKGRDVMFHVSTLLPYKEKGDRQQLERKRHIGNDIVTVVFQNDSTPFVAGSIASQFLHVFIVVQVVDPLSENTRYKVSVVSKGEVPDFGPALPSPAVFSKGPEFREWLLTKLINAETAARKGPVFTKLETRTRGTLLQHLVDKLKQLDVQADNSPRLARLFAKSDSLPHLGPRRPRHSIDSGSVAHSVMPFSPFAPSMSHDLELQRANAATLPREKTSYRPRDGDVDNNPETFDSDEMRLKRQKSKARRQELLQKVQVSLHSQSVKGLPVATTTMMSYLNQSGSSTPASYSPSIHQPSFPYRHPVAGLMSSGSCGSPVATSGASSLEHSPLGSMNSLISGGGGGGGGGAVAAAPPEEVSNRKESVDSEEPRAIGSDKQASLSVSSAVFSSNASSQSSESEEDIMARVIQQLQNEVKKLTSDKVDLLRETVVLKKENTELKRKEMETDLEIKEMKEELKSLKSKVTFLQNKQQIIDASSSSSGKPSRHHHKSSSSSGGESSNRRYSDQTRQYRLRILNLDESQATHL